MNDNDNSLKKTHLGELNCLNKTVNSSFESKKEDRSTTKIKLLSEADKQVQKILSDYLFKMNGKNSDNHQVEETILLLKDLSKKRRRKNPIKSNITKNKDDFTCINGKRKTIGTIIKKEFDRKENNLFQPKVPERKISKSEIYKKGELILHHDNNHIKGRKRSTIFNPNLNRKKFALSIEPRIQMPKFRNIIHEDKKDEIENVREDNDIRNFMPISNEKFHEFSGICRDLRKSIILQPTDLHKIHMNIRKSEIYKNTTKLSEGNKNLDTPFLKNSSFVNQDEKRKPSILLQLNSEDEEEEQSSEDEEIKELNEHRFRVLRKSSQPVYDSLSGEESDEQISHDIYVKPTSVLRVSYDAILFFLTIYSMFLTPYEICFTLNTDVSIDYQLISNLLIDTIFVFDIVISFFTAYYDLNENLVTDFKLILIHYLSTWFTLDFLSGFPINSILDITRYINPNGKFAIATKHILISHDFSLLNLTKLFRLLKGFKVFMINSFIHKIASLYEESPLYKWARLYITIFIFLFSVHFLACVFIFLGQNYYPNWIMSIGLDPKDKVDIYVASISFISATVFSIGYGDVTSCNLIERSFNIILLVIGLMIYSWSISSLSAYYTDDDQKILEYKKGQTILEEICLENDNMPKLLYDKIQRFLIYRLKSEKLDCNVIYEALPSGLKNRLIFEMYKPIILNFVFFRNFDTIEFIIKVIMSLKPLAAIKNERLVKDGEVMEEIIFVKRGKLSLEYPVPVILNQEPPKPVTRNSIFMTNVKGTYREKSIINFEKFKTHTNELKDTECSIEKTQEIRQQYIKLLDIRRNEHFGDVLMFLNKKSPLSVRVNSQIAELLLLKRNDAVEISMSFPKIWREIIEKSLFNMKQINKLINHSLKFFFNHNAPCKDTILSSQITNNHNEKLTPKNLYSYQSQSIKDFLQAKKDELKSQFMDSRLCVLKDLKKKEEKVKKEITKAKKEDSVIQEENATPRAARGNILNNIKESSPKVEKQELKSNNQNSRLLVDCTLKDDSAFEFSSSKLNLKMYEESAINEEYDENERELKENALYDRGKVKGLTIYDYSFFNEEAQRILKERSGRKPNDSHYKSTTKNIILEKKNKPHNKNPIIYINQFPKLSSSSISQFTISTHQKKFSTKSDNSCVIPKFQKLKSFFHESGSNLLNRTSTDITNTSTQKKEINNFQLNKAITKKPTFLSPSREQKKNVLKPICIISPSRMQKRSPRKVSSKNLQNYNMLEKISTNIAKNSLNLHKPEVFYSSMLNEALNQKKKDNDDGLEDLNTKIDGLLDFLKNEDKENHMS